MNEDLNTLIEINKKLDSKETQLAVKNAEIHNPAKTVENSLVSYVNGRLERLDQDADFTDLIRMAIRTRLPEFSPDQLITLLNNTSTANNVASDNMMKLFRNETSGKTVIEHLRDNDVSSTAAQLYNSTDSKDILQAITYFNQIMSSQNNKQVIEGQIEETD